MTERVRKRWNKTQENWASTWGRLLFQFWVLQVVGASLVGLGVVDLQGFWWPSPRSTEKYPVSSESKTILDIFTARHPIFETTSDICSNCNCLWLKSFSISFQVSCLEKMSALIQMIKHKNPWLLRAVWTTPTHLWLSKLLPFVLRAFSFKTKPCKCMSCLWALGAFLPSCFSCVYEGFILSINDISM